jgi:signal transduction histidine kinase
VRSASHGDRSVLLEAVLEEAPLRREMRDYAVRLFGLSVFISLLAGALVYAALQWLAVQPLRKITDSMIGFRQAPLDRTRMILPSGRRDEVGVAEHALAEMQDQLRQALAQRERLVAVGEAVTKVSHDLKNILATAMLESDRLSASGNEDTRRITAGIARAIDRAVAMSKSIVRFAREGLPEVHRRPVDLAAVLDETIAAVRPAFPECTMAHDVDRAVRVFVDPALLERALENIIRNAAEAGGKTIAVAWRADLSALAISDDGPGLPPRARDHLFMPFAGSARPGGSGLGLPIARESLRAQGGDVQLEATGDTGTTFIVRLAR